MATEKAEDYYADGQGIPSRTVVARAELFDQEQFEERLNVREDPHLWARLLRDADASYVDEELAVKRQREDSITADVDRVYRHELWESLDLALSYDEFDERFEERRAMVHYKHGRRSLRDGDAGTARKHLLEAIVAGERGIKALALLTVACLPAGHSRVLSWLEEAV